MTDPEVVKYQAAYRAALVQRNQALDNVLSLIGDIAVLKARIQELEKPPES